MPYQIADLASGILLLSTVIVGIVLVSVLILSAALMGWLAGCLFVRAVRPADAHEGRR